MAHRSHISVCFPQKVPSEHLSWHA
jgi:hypothetical protein